MQMDLQKKNLKSNTKIIDSFIKNWALQKALLLSLVSLLSFSSLGQFENPPMELPPPPDELFKSANSFLGNQEKSPKNEPVLKKETREKLSKADIEDITNENFPDIIESFDFPNADIQDVVKAMSELTGKNFILDQNVRGKITIIAPTKITVAEAYKAFLSALAFNNLTLVKSGDFYKIRNSKNAMREGIETYSGDYFPNTDLMITRIIHLKHISADEFQKNMGRVLVQTGEMNVYAPTNSLIISDLGSNIERIAKIISQMDVPGFEDQLEVVKIRFAKAKDLAELINKIVNKGEAKNTGSTFSAGLPRFGRSASPQGNQGSAYYMVIPDDRTNSLIVVGNKPGLEKIKKLIAQLDFRLLSEDAGGIHVYFVKNGKAEDIAKTLTGVAKDAGPAKSGSGGGTSVNAGMGGASINYGGGAVGASAGGGSQDIFGGDVKITADATSNSLVIVAAKQDYEVILRLLRKLDVARNQVYVEAIIMEMKLTDDFNWETGVVKYNGTEKEPGYGKIGWQGISGDSLTGILSPTGGSGTILGFTGDKKVTVKNPSGTDMVMPDLLSFVTFLQKNKNANILSTPQIMAMDNQEAEIKVGDRFATSQTLSTPANGGPTTSTANFEDALIELKLKPYIGPNNVRMEITNQVKQPTQAATPKTLQDSTTPLATRFIKTTIVVPNGDTAVLGGLMKDDETESISKVPLLGDIPLIGWLFKSKQTTKTKTNMVVFLTPKIVKNPNEHKEVLNKKIDDRLDFIKSVGGQDPYGSTIDKVRKTKVSKSVATPIETNDLPPASNIGEDVEDNIENEIKSE